MGLTTADLREEFVNCARRGAAIEAAGAAPQMIANLETAHSIRGRAAPLEAAFHFNSPVLV